MNSSLILFLAFLGLFVHGVFSLSSNSTSTTCVCTTVPCPVVGSNSLTVGGGSVGTYVYVDHGVPVVSSAKVTITSNDIDKGSDTTSCTQSYSRTLDDDGVQDCDAGHILAHRLGGPGNQPINIFPQDLSVNRGSYAQFEDSIYDCIAYLGASSASLSWTFYYDSNTRTKPYQVKYVAEFNGGTCVTLSQLFSN